ncbi:hypothetical protein F5I97DRAFT_1388759 [Phlebopus sp. FC_14]|nr:hypothetical protein F5I97DRAFT_1388759 [Phlebopus sp. FC_14]
MKTINHSVKIPLVYNPRWRPYMPILRGDLPFMSTTKSCPKEWHQVLCTMNTIEPSGWAPIHVVLYPISASLRFFGKHSVPPSRLRGPSPFLVPFIGRSGAGGNSGQKHTGIAIRIYLLRQTWFKILDRPIASSHVLGERSLERSQSLPPGGAFHPLGDGFELSGLGWR